MPTPAQDLEKMLADFERDHALAGANLRELLKSTPELETRMLAAIDKGNLDLIKPLDPAQRARGALGGFDPSDDSIALPMDMLEASARNPQDANTLRMVFGHEIEHSVNKADIDTLVGDFDREVEKIAQGPSPHDYTELLEARNRGDRLRESNDQISGFNVLAAHVRRENPDATAEQMNAKLYASSDQMQQYFDVGIDANGQKNYTPKPGLSIGANGQIAATPDNVEAMGVHFYDRNHYPERYAHRNLSLAYQAEHDAARQHPDRPAPDIRVDLHKLNLPGFPLPPGFSDPSGSVRGPAPGSPSPPSQPAQPASSGADPAAPHPREAGHRDHAYYQMLRDKLPAEVPDNAVAQAMLEAKRSGLDATQIDPNKIGVNDGKIWIGGKTPGFHASADATQAPPMNQIARELQELPAHTPAAPSVGKNEQVQAPAPMMR